MISSFIPFVEKEALLENKGGGGKGGGVCRNWEPKRGDRWNLWKDSEGGPLKFAWKMKARGGDRESHQKLLGRIASVK